MIEDIKEKALKEGVPIIKDEGLIFLLSLIKENNYKDIHIDTLEKNIDMYNQAIKNIEDNNLKDQIEVHFGPIEEYKTDKMYDLIFVDAAKAQYGKYMEQFINNLKPEGKMVFDNMIFHGLIYDVDNIQSKNLRNLVKKIIKFRQLVHNDERFDIMMNDNIGDGILVLSWRKK